MHFGLSDEQELLQETVRGFVENECPAPRLREIFDRDEEHDPAFWKGLAEMGVAGLCVPERFGGAGLEVLDLALVNEVLGEGAAPSPLFGHSLACFALVHGGSEAQRERWLPRLASGEAIGTVAFGEPGDRWQPEEWGCAHRSGEVRGQKVFVPGASAAELIVVGCAGGELALVERGATGCAVLAVPGVDRTRRVADLRLDGAAAELLETGAAVSSRLRDAALCLLAADAFGAAWRLIRMTIDYCGTREQFDTPLTQFQAVKHQIADAALEIEPTRGLYWYAAHAIDHLPEDAPQAAAVAKAHITDRALEVARMAVELHGGIGFTWECDVQMWFKRVLFDRTFLGGPAIHRERSAALVGW